jgi:muconolactone D-isomerase
VEFLTNATISIPSDIDEETRDALIAAEGVRAGQLAASGELSRAWRTPGHWGNWCLWEQADLAALTAALESLPLFCFMEISIHPLDPHSSDPRSG